MNQVIDSLVDWLRWIEINRLSTCPQWQSQDDSQHGRNSFLHFLLPQMSVIDRAGCERSVIEMRHPRRRMSLRQGWDVKSYLNDG
jgi:hypothetical protein